MPEPHIVSVQPLAQPHSSFQLLISAGPTHEPIDEVRYLGNRSSGRLGIELADESARQGHEVTLLLGPTHLTPSDSRVRVIRFRTTSDLQALLAQHAAKAKVLVMAAAVADFRVKGATDPHAPRPAKLKRSAANLTLELEPTPDLLAGCAKAKRPDQLFVGFALEPEDRLLASAKDKLARKSIDMIVANPLETMDAEAVRATVLAADGSSVQTPGTLSKRDFAPWLLGQIARAIPSATKTS